MSAAVDPVPRHAPLALIAAAVLAFVVMRAPLLAVPLERDEGEYAYIAQRMLAGEVPYRDAFDQKPPGVFVAYLLAFATAGATVEGIRLFLAFWTAAAGVVLYGLVRRVAGGLAAGFALLVFWLASADPRVQGHAANTENWMLLPLVLAAAACLRGWQRGDRISWLACGALAACACWFKQVAASDACLFAAAAFGDAVIGRPAPGLGKALARLALFGLGGALASAPVLLWFAASGAFAPFIDAVLLHNLAYTQSSSAGEGLLNLLVSLGRQLPSFWLVWSLAAVGWLLPGSVPRRVRHALAAWWLASFAGATIGLHFRPHYFLQTLPALAALAGIGAAALAERLSRREGARRWLAPAALAGLVVAVPLAVHRPLLLAESPAVVSRRIYGLNPFPEAAVIADQIRRGSRPDDRVFIVGSEPQILFLAGRRSATRYIFFYPLTGDYPDARARQQEAIDEVRAAQPLYILWVDVPTSLQRTPSSEPLIFDAALDLIARNYQLELIAHVDASLGTYRILRGEQARRWVGETLASQSEPLPLLALYRRMGDFTP
jgi:4-amino-4-deoxy-L-arabinose transferase-like glycosyltransferase